jgi:hypothetical protein
MNEFWNDIITWAGFIIAAFVAFYNWRQNEKKEDKSQSSELTTLMIKLETITQGIAEIKSDLRGATKENQLLKERVVVLEQGQKTLFNRVEGIEENCRAQSREIR